MSMTIVEERKAASYVGLAIVFAVVGFIFEFIPVAFWHELGHAVGALLSGRRIASIGLSEMRYYGDPHAPFVTMMGPIGGVLFPFLIVKILAKRDKLWPLVAWLSLKPIGHVLFSGALSTHDQAKLIDEIGRGATDAFYAGFFIVGFIVAGLAIALAVLTIGKQLGISRK